VLKVGVCLSEKEILKMVIENNGGIAKLQILPLTG